MASTNDIRNRINGVKDTQKITNAMYLIASTKMRRAKNDLLRTRPYFNALGSELKRIFYSSVGAESPYFYPDDGTDISGGTYGYLVITADKGLAGSYNQNVIKTALRELSKHENSKLFVLGEYGRHYFTRHGIAIEQSFSYTAQNPTLDRAREIADILLNLYDRGELKKIFVVYTDWLGELAEEIKCIRILPFHRASFSENQKTAGNAAADFEFTPSVKTVLENVVPSYVSGFIYSAMVDSFCSEQNSRMTAMDSANRNAEKLVGNLSREYNRVRQAAITREITEISAGAQAQRKSVGREDTL